MRWVRGTTEGADTEIENSPSRSPAPARSAAGLRQGELQLVRFLNPGT